jgi:hypothetical protein
MPHNDVDALDAAAGAREGEIEFALRTREPPFTTMGGSGIVRSPAADNGIAVDDWRTCNSL